MRLERPVADRDRPVARLLGINLARGARVGEERLVAEREETLVLAVDADERLVDPDDVERGGVLRLVEAVEAELARAPDRRGVEFRGLRRALEQIGRQLFPWVERVARLILDLVEPHGIFE
jgi:hypothetical protein